MRRFSPARKALIDLLNLPDLHFVARGQEGEITIQKIDALGAFELIKQDDDPRRTAAFALAQRFIESYGQLRPAADPLFAEGELFEYARLLRQVWTDAKKNEFRAAESTLKNIFAAGDPIKHEGQAFTADLDVKAGEIAFAPATLLQTVGLEMLHSRRALKRCPICKDFFFPSKGNRRKYCENKFRDCQHEGRNRRAVKNTRNWRAREAEKGKDNANAKRSDRKN